MVKDQKHLVVASGAELDFWLEKEREQKSLWAKPFGFPLLGLRWNSIVVYYPRDVSTQDEKYQKWLKHLKTKLVPGGSFRVVY